MNTTSGLPSAFELIARHFAPLAQDVDPVALPFACQDAEFDEVRQNLALEGVSARRPNRCRTA